MSAASAVRTMEQLLATVSHYGYAGLFAAMLLGIVGIPFPVETILIFCGYLVATGRMQAAPAFLTAVAGSIAGISISYLLGRTLGHTFLEKYGRWIRITPGQIRRVHSGFERIGNWVLTFGYFVLGVRHFTALLAGITQLKFSTFARYAWSGAILWVATFLSIGYFVGGNWRSALVFVHRYTWVVAVVVFLGSALAWWIWYARQRRRVREE